MTTPDPILEEARRLYELGWAVHWLKPKSKAPVNDKWEEPTRDSWEWLVRQYETKRRQWRGKSPNLGVRLGGLALPDGTFLANIDIDVKGGEARHHAEAMAVFAEAYPDLVDWPSLMVQTGMGRRYFVRTKTPARSVKIKRSTEQVRVLMPSTPIGEHQRHLLTAAELKAGWRMRPAWEVELMGAGKQVVLPPSIHPDTGTVYHWTGGEEIPLIDAEPAAVRKGGVKTSAKASAPFVPVEVELEWTGLSDRLIKMLTEGVDIDGSTVNRSDGLLAVAIGMVRAGFSDVEALSCLTNRSWALGQAPWDRRGAGNLQGAVAWAKEYCLDKAKEICSAEAVFDDLPENEAEAEVIPKPALSPRAAREQKSELTKSTSADGDGDWRRHLTRTKGGKIEPSLANTVLVLQRAVGHNVFERNSFTGTEHYGMKPPWVNGSDKKRRELEDVDATNARLWLSRKWHFEPSRAVVEEAILSLSDANSFHPILKDLRALPAWDGVPRIDTWLKRYFGATDPDEYLAQVLRKWMLASIMRVHQPGYKFDWMPVLQGPQNLGKSSFGKLLFGQKYFTDRLPKNLDDKDTILQLRGIQCVEWGELASMRTNDLETVKAFVTRTHDRLRLPFGRRTTDIPRQCVFYATTDKERYLRDDAGDRRFNPVHVGQLNWAAIEGDRDQLWAEAMFIHEWGLEKTLYLEGEAASVAVKTQQEKRVQTETDYMVEELVLALEEWKAAIANGTPVGFDFGRFRLAMLFGPMAPLKDWQPNGKGFYHAGKALKEIENVDGLDLRIRCAVSRGVNIYRAEAK